MYSLNATFSRFLCIEQLLFSLCLVIASHNYGIIQIIEYIYSSIMASKHNNIIVEQIIVCFLRKLRLFFVTNAYGL